MSKQLSLRSGSIEETAKNSSIWLYLDCCYDTKLAYCCSNRRNCSEMEMIDLLSLPLVQTVPAHKYAAKPNNRIDGCYNYIAEQGWNNDIKQTIKHWADAYRIIYIHLIHTLFIVLKEWAYKVSISQYKNVTASSNQWVKKQMGKQNGPKWDIWHSRCCIFCLYSQYSQLYKVYFKMLKACSSWCCVDYTHPVWLEEQTDVV